MNILLLSPHRDDAAFSLSLSITHWLQMGHHVTVMNVFTRSLYAPYADAEQKPERERMDYVSNLRKQEDHQTLKALGIQLILDLDVEDAPIRLHCDSSIVCDMDVRSDDVAIPKIRAALEAQLEHDGTDTVLILPLGLGHHVDHRTARDAALPLSGRVACAFYEELPYATRDGVRVDLSRFRNDAAAQQHEPLFPVLCHGTHTRPVEFKRSTAMMYKSQIDPQLAHVIANFAHRYHGGERLWANEAWLRIAGEHRLSTRQRNLDAEPLPA